MKKLVFFVLLACALTYAFGTTLVQVEKTCAVCGAKSTQTEVMSTNQMGSADLDLRPPEMMRSTIVYWVQKCPVCGYCARDLGTLIDKAGETVKTTAYKKQLPSSYFPDLANQFLCMMLIYEAAADQPKAIYASICGAWASDDAGNDKAAHAARGISVRRLLALKKSGENYMNQPGGDQILLADFSRRTGEFSSAREYAEKGLSLTPEEIIAKILTYEVKLIENKDTAAHTVEEAVR